MLGGAATYREPSNQRQPSETSSYRQDGSFVEFPIPRRVLQPELPMRLILQLFIRLVIRARRIVTYSRPNSSNDAETGRSTLRPRTANTYIHFKTVRQRESLLGEFVLGRTEWKYPPGVVPDITSKTEA